MKKLGLIGYPLTHSFSKKYFTEKFNNENIKNWEYLNFELKNIDEFMDFISKYPELTGLNITIPYKEKILKYVDWQDAVVKEIGATNTLKLLPNKIKAYNTDVYGFEESLKPYLKSHHHKALILGTGGASKAVSYVLKKMEISHKYVSRNPKKEDEIGYKDLKKEIIENHQIIINTTPVGTYLFPEKKVNFPYDFIQHTHLFYDLIYNPSKTDFLKEAEKRNATIVNGLKMLHLQAEKSWEIWNDKN